MGDLRATADRPALPTPTTPHPPTPKKPAPPTKTRPRRDPVEHRRARRSLYAIIALLCVIPFWILSVALPLVAATRVEPIAKGRNLKLPSPGTTITITFIFAVIELFAFFGAMLAYVLNSGPTKYRRRLAFLAMGFVTFEAIATGAWVVSRAISFEKNGVCSGALLDEVEECKAGLDMIMAMGAVRFGYAPCVLVATLIYPGPWTRSPI